MIFHVQFLYFFLSPVTFLPICRYIAFGILIVNNWQKIKPERYNILLRKQFGKHPEYVKENLVFDSNYDSGNEQKWLDTGVMAGCSLIFGWDRFGKFSFNHFVGKKATGNILIRQKNVQQCYFLNIEARWSLVYI